MKKLLLLALTSFSLTISAVETPRLSDYLDRREIQKMVREQIADQDVNFDIGLGNIELIKGINLANDYNYDVEPSYADRAYTRIDKWDVNVGINVGDVLKDFVDVPFSFSVNRQNSFFFVRQFQSALDAMKALPYGPNKLPLNAKLALKNLNPGDFVSMPASLSVAVASSFSTSFVAPVMISANAGIYYVISGEFIVQVFKLDETHVRLKLISKRGKEVGANHGVGVGFNLYGINILENDLAHLDISYNPGAQFIIDYIFDLKDPEAQKAYNQILSSPLKFKDIIVTEKLNDAKNLKDKLISSYEKADDIFEADKLLDPSKRRVNRIFKGFNDYNARTRHLKLSFVVANMTRDKVFTQNELTFIDKNEKPLAFYYPNFSKYFEGHFGKWIIDFHDQSFQNNFGLLPQLDQGGKVKNPDLGLTFERKDGNLTAFEQKEVLHFLISQIPAEFARDIDLSQWKSNVTKYGSRIFFQLILKAQGFEYLKNLSAEDLRKKLLLYVEERRNIYVGMQPEMKDEAKVSKLKDFILIDRFTKDDRLLGLANSLADILQNKNNNAQEMLKRLVQLNESGVFDKIGVGFLISLLPPDKLQELVYLKLEMFSDNSKSISTEIGTLNYQALYKELNEMQARLSNRSYNLQLSERDKKMADVAIRELDNE